MGQVARGPLMPMDQAPVLLASAAELPNHVLPDPDKQPLHFRLADIVQPACPGGLPLIPFFRLHDSRYQMYWELTSKQELLAKQDRLAAAERLKLAREAATLDSVAVGEQQPEVEHALVGEDTQSGEFQGRRWRHGRSFQYSFDLHGATAAELVVTYSGSDRDRKFDVFANETLLATERMNAEKPGELFERHYPLSAGVVSAATKSRVIIRFSAHAGSLAGGVYDVRLMRPTPAAN
jgi:hypothetical protein